jgi:hypothetical protein
VILRHQRMIKTPIATNRIVGPRHDK